MTSSPSCRGSRVRAQVPLEQKPRPKPTPPKGNKVFSGYKKSAKVGAMAKVKKGASFGPFLGSSASFSGGGSALMAEEEATFDEEEEEECEVDEILEDLAQLVNEQDALIDNILTNIETAAPMPSMKGRRRSAAPPVPRKRGAANAARVSRGSLHDTWPGLTQRVPKRDAHQHVTVTVVIYNTVAGGVPGVDDVKAAIDDMESLYRACGWKGHLADGAADFMKSELTVSDVAKIAEKVVTQPYVPAGEAPVGGDAFPVPISDGGGGGGSGDASNVQGDAPAEGAPQKRDCLLM